MGVEVAGCCLQQLLPPCNTCSSKTIDAVFLSISAAASSSSNKRRGFADQTGHRSLSLGARRSQSLDIFNGRGVRGRCRDHHALTRAISATFQTFPTEDDDDDDDDNNKELELLNQLRELANRVHQQSISTTSDSETIPASKIERGGQDDAAPSRPSFSHSTEPPWPAIGSESQQWPDLFPESLERKANSIELPLSLRMIKKKKLQDHSLISEAASETSSSVKMAFSSMVFMIRELQRYALQMREFLFLENLQGVLARAHAEMHASFVWLFQQIFSCTPTLMLSLMLLLANFTVYSMAASATPPAATAPHVVVSVVVEVDNHYNQFYPFTTKTISPIDGRAASIGGGGIGGGKERPIGGSTDDARPYYQSITSPSSYESTEEELRLWSGIVDEASRMQAVWRDDVLMDPDTLQRFVSPVSVELPPEDKTTYLQTEAMYHKALSQEPNNSILLCNFAQFLYLVLQDHDRAEYYFKRAIQAEPIDAESMSRYANFLWIAKNDIGAAEETFLEAIAADPGNTYYAGNYAHFLWSTGGEETCYPLD